MKRSLLLFLFSSFSLFGQTFALMPVPKQQFFTNAGIPLSGGFVCTYAAGTSTPLATYTDSTGGAQNQNPVPLDTAGRAAIWLSAASYKIVLQASNGGSCTGTVIWSIDSVTGNNLLPTLTNISATTLTLTGNLTLANGAVCGTNGCSSMIFPSGAAFNGGLTTLAGSNSTINIGSGGNFYVRTFSGGDTDCSSTANGWMGMRVDNHTIQFCAGSTLYSVGGSSGGAGPTLAGTNTWTGLNTHTVAVNFNGGTTTCTSTDGSTLLGGCNASFSVGTLGNLYIRTFSGADATCGGSIPNGWFGVRTDGTPALEVCVGGVVKKIALT